MNRRFTFSDDANIEILNRAFIPCVANTHELQFGKNNVSRWFSEVVKRMDSKELRNQLGAPNDKGSIQGLYIFAADGTPYLWMNDNNPREVTGFLSRGVKTFEAHRPSQRIDSILSDKWNKPDPSTSIVRVFTRIRPTRPDWPVLNFGVGRDHLWILKEEIEEIVRSGSTDARVPLPRNLTERLCRYHLVDNVRGEPDMWREVEIKERNFGVHRIWCPLKDSSSSNAQSCVNANSPRSHKSVSAAPATSTGVSIYEIDGSYRLETADRKRGVVGKLSGIIEIDNCLVRVKKFRAIGNATAWGQSRFTPDPPPVKFQLVFGLKDVDDVISRNVPPQGMAWGDYLCPE